MPPRAYVPDTGDVVWLQFDPQAGHEQAGHRPALVISPASYNSKTGLMVCCPMSTKVKGHPFEVVTEIDGMECAVLSDQVKSLDWKIRRAKKKAAVSAEVMLHVRAKMKALLQIPSGKAAHLDSVDRACPLCAPHLAEHSPASEHPLPRTSGAA